jgi:hypothetical protein
MKFYKYKQLQRMTFFGYDDLNATDTTSFSRTSVQSRTVATPAVAAVAAVVYAAGPPIVYAAAAVVAAPVVPVVTSDTKILRFNINRLFQTPLTQNARIVIEQIYLPSSGTRPRTGPITVRMNNLNTHAHDSQNKGFNSSLIYTSEFSDTIYTNPSPDMLYNFDIAQNFFQNGHVEFQLTYPDIEISMDFLNRFYISFIVYDIDEQELLLKNTPEVDYKNFEAHMNIHNGRIPK